MSQQKLFNYLKESGSILEGHFLLSSGLHSPNYVQCALALKNPIKAAEFGKELFKLWKWEKPNIIVSPALGGIIIGYEVARFFKVPFIFTERENNIMTLRRGFEIKKGEKAIIVEDVFTTGKSTLEVAQILKSKKAKILGAMSIINRMGKNKLPFKNISLLKLDLKTYTKENCPLCLSKIPLIKPGSRA